MSVDGTRKKFEGFGGGPSVGGGPGASLNPGLVLTGTENEIKQSKLENRKRCEALQTA